MAKLKLIISNNIMLLKGVGEEYYVDNKGNVLAKFLDGNIVTEVYNKDCNGDVTKVA